MWLKKVKKMRNKMKNLSFSQSLIRLVIESSLIQLQNKN